MKSWQGIMEPFRVEIPGQPVKPGQSDTRCFSLVVVLDRFIGKGVVDIGDGSPEGIRLVNVIVFSLAGFHDPGDLPWRLDAVLLTGPGQHVTGNDDHVLHDLSGLSENLGVDLLQNDFFGWVGIGRHQKRAINIARSVGVDVMDAAIQIELKGNTFRPGHS